MDSYAVRGAVAALPVPVGTDFWTERRREIRARLIEDGPDRFLTWPSIVSTMFVGNAPYIDREFDALPPSFLVNDPMVGEPQPYHRNALLTGNIIHQCYHMSRFSAISGAHVRDMSSIQEFGGGYGLMAYVARALGFRGQYSIDDFPELAVLQSWYLGRCNQSIRHDVAPAPGLDMFIALFSLSEASDAIQAAVLKNLSSKHVLIGCSQASYSFIDRVLALDGYRWTRENIEDPWTCYLIGTKREPTGKRRR